LWRPGRGGWAGGLLGGERLVEVGDEEGVELAADEWLEVRGDVGRQNMTAMPILYLG